MSSVFEGARKDRYGNLTFVACLPALRRFGRRFDAVRESGQEDDGGAPSEQDIEEVRRHLGRVAEALEERCRRDNPALYGQLSERGFFERLRAGDWSEGRFAGSQDAGTQLIDDVTGELAGALAARGVSVGPPGDDRVGFLAECAAAEHRFVGRPKPGDLPVGYFVVDCGEVASATENQRALFGWLGENQEAFGRTLSAALQDHYLELLPTYEQELGISAGEVPYLPKPGAGDEVDDLFRVARIYLHPTRPRVGLVLDCAFMEDFPLGVLVEDGQVIRVGPDNLAYVTNSP